MADSGYVGVRAKRTMESNDRRRPMVLQGTMGALIAVEGSADRPRFRVVFATEVMLKLHAQPAEASGDRHHDGSRADQGARPVRVQSWAEIRVGVDDIVFEPVLDAVAVEKRPPRWPPSLLSATIDDSDAANPVRVPAL